MYLKYKPDFEETQKRFEAFWNREIIDRPLVYITAPQNDIDNRIPVPYRKGSDGNFLEALTIYEEWASQTYFAGDSIPFFRISMGPDQFAGFLGAELIEGPDGHTNWAKPCIDHLDNVKIELSEDNQIWKTVREFYKVAAEYSEGKFLLNMLDLHSHLDCLSAMRGPEKLCMDLMDHPETIEKIVLELRRLYPIIYNTVYELADMKNRGVMGFAPFYCKGKFATTQCDFMCMMNPAQAKALAFPAIQEEARFLDYCVHHFDGGPAALVHLDNFLEELSEIDVVQWVPGAGQRPTLEWMDVLKKIQKASKGLWIYDCTVEQIKQHHKELRPEGVLYSLQVSSKKEADNLILWLKNNT